MSRNSMVIALIVSAAMAANVSAASFPTLVVQDKFTTTNGANINGRTPQDANLTGDTWHIYASNAGATVATDGGRQVATFGGDEGQRISLSTISDAVMRVEGTLRFAGTNTAPSTPFRSAGIGFTTNGTPPGTPPGNATGFFTGLGIGPVSNTDSTLALKLFNNTAAGNGGPVSQIAIAGQLASTYHDLSYTINRSTGALLDVKLDGTSYSFSTSAFTFANTAFFTFVTSSAVGGLGNGFFDSVTLSTPEPASMGLLALGATGLLRRRRS